MVIKIFVLYRTNIPDWARQPQHESGIPGWINVVIALAAIIPILYLLLRDTKVKAFLKPTEFQDLPLEHKEVSKPPAHHDCHATQCRGPYQGCQSMLSRLNYWISAGSTHNSRRLRC